MQIDIISLGNRPPKWVVEAFSDYIKRFPKHLKVVLHEVPPQPTPKKESEKIRSLLKPNAHIIALDEKGEQFSSQHFAKQFSHACEHYPSIAFIIGGANGLGQEIRSLANRMISLSKLTFPHMLARVVLIEQLYRAYTILTDHPYHRD